MTTPEHTRRITSYDGTEIVARVQGEGEPLVLLPAGPGDCETTWRPLLPFLTDRFTCYLLDTRGRGRSDDHRDHSPDRLVEDIVACVDAIGRPVGVVEWGSFIGASWGLLAAQRSEAVSAVATYDPLPFDVAEEDDAARFEAVLAGVAALAGEGRLAEAARNFVEGLARHGYYTPEDMAEGATYAFWEASAPNIPMFLDELEQAEGGEGGWSDPALLARTTVPVLVMHGARSHAMNITFARHVTDHVAEPHVRSIAGAGHYGPHTAPEAVAGALARFFEAVPAGA